MPAATRSKPRSLGRIHPCPDLDLALLAFKSMRDDAVVTVPVYGTLLQQPQDTSCCRAECMEPYGWQGHSEPKHGAGRHPEHGQLGRAKDGTLKTILQGEEWAAKWAEGTAGAEVEGQEERGEGQGQASSDGQSLQKGREGNPRAQTRKA